MSKRLSAGRTAPALHAGHSFADHPVTAQRSQLIAG
jgi:hypothetical protein